MCTGHVFSVEIRGPICGISSFSLPYVGPSNQAGGACAFTILASPLRDLYLSVLKMKPEVESEFI